MTAAHLLAGAQRMAARMGCVFVPNERWTAVATASDSNSRSQSHDREAGQEEASRG